ncbi:hypothetical protein [Mucilaginibacter celer]|uniref:PKD domain-containing protein n=1 Tax=Mucilaginibacter celer TaxID=2305508 RepID=A0A494VNE2_9SPHI|nr:hypothetical protein [Mucilaginibacter celer]AYL94530.1 hypothetical protein HYN43_004090 [Mucilaginibacter celer]
MPPVTNIKLTDITLEYNSFVDSQVLTAKQLNDIVDFFEDQQRLTRTCLIGVGLVCGLSFKGDANGITVCKGCGVTTDGDLLYLPETVYKNFRAYDNSLIKYPPFYPLGTDSAQMDLWELVAADDKGAFPADSSPLTTFKTKTGNELLEMYGLLYLEYYSKDPDACTAIDCDNQGRKQVARPKVLLVSQANMNQIIEQSGSEVIYDDIYKKYFNAYNSYIDAPVLAARRVFLNSQNIASSSTLTAAFANTAKNGASALVNAIKSLYGTFKFVLDPQSAYSIDGIAAIINATLSISTAPLQAQYLYDFYKDLLATYNELRALLVDIVYQCCPNIYAFPKHIMLGALTATPTARPTAYRHRFYASPAVSVNREKLNAAINLLDRLSIMSSAFAPSANAGVKITPSVDNSKPVEARAIPFYYGKTVALAQKWSYSRWLQGTDKLILGYNASQYSPANDAVVNPLSYSIDGNNFFRIEGHIGKTYTDAMEAVEKIRTETNLPFDVAAIRLGNVTLDDIDINDYACQFNDLEATLRAFQAEQNCLYGDVSQFFSSFNTKTGYAVAKEVKYEIQGQVLEFANEEEAAAPVVTEKRAAKAEDTGAQPAAAQQEVTTGYAINKKYVMDGGIDAVDNNINKVQGALGSYIDLIRQKGAVSISDYAQAVGVLVDVSQTGSYEQAIAVDIPIRMIAGTRNISQWLPDRLVDIDEDTIDNFTAKLDELCDEVRSAAKKSREIFAKPDYVRKGYEDDYELQLWRLSENCCAGQALAVILKEIQDRKTKLLQQLTFAAYSASHTGLEHLAGVPAGGTFVMVYAATANTPKPTTAPDKRFGDERFSPLQDDKRFVKGFEDDRDMMEYVAKNVDYEDIPDAIKYYENLSKRRYNPKNEAVIIAKTQELARRYGKEREVAATPDVPVDVVFADFCLPYMCCSDCPPVGFIMPKPQVGLSLPKAVACSDEGLLPFKVSPVDGIIKASAGFEDTVVSKEGDKITYFDTTKVKDGSFGQAIKFTVNEQPTECTITVFKHPEVTPTADPSDTTSYAVYIRLGADTNQKEGDSFAYTWTLPDGQVHANLTSPDDLAILQYDFLRKNFPDGKITFKLSVTNHDCTDTKTVDYTVEIPEEPVVLQLDKGEVCSDEGNVNFTTVQPEGGIVTSKTLGEQVKLLGSQWVVDPSKGPFEKKISDFMVNDKPAPDCAILIHEHPVAAFEYKVVTDAAKGVATVTLTNKTANAANFKFIWQFDDGTTSTEVNMVKTFPMANYPRGRNTTIILTAINGKFDKCRSTFNPGPIALPAGISQTFVTRLPASETTIQDPAPKLTVKQDPTIKAETTPKIDPTTIKKDPGATK